jgi:Dyp-type peroxidase family
MKLQQQPPFLICVPIKHSKAWPGLAARKVEALLDRLGNPAVPAMRAALDASRVVHFLSLAVIWDDDSKDPPILVMHVAADGAPKTAMAALVEHAGALLLPVFQAAANVENLSALKQLFERYWMKPEATSFPISWLHRGTGLPFQGTPGLTVERIKEDEGIAEKAKAAVFRHASLGATASLSYLEAARREVNVASPSGGPFEYSEQEPSLAKAGFIEKAWTFFGLIVIDWSLLFVLFLASLAVDIHAIMVPLNYFNNSNHLNPANDFLRLLLSAAAISVVIGVSLQLFKNSTIIKRATRTPVTLIMSIFGVLGALLAAIFFEPATIPRWLEYPIVKTFVLGSQNLFIWWMSFGLSGMAAALFVGVVASILVWFLRVAEIRNQPCDADPDPTFLAEIIRREDLPPHKQNHMIAVSTIAPGILAGFFRRFVSLPAGLYAASLTVRSGVFKTGFLSGIGTIHFLQWARIPRTNKLFFAADYDGSWQSYLEDAITLLPQGANAIWSNAKGFPATRLLFFKGANDGDRFKRWVRRQMIPTRFWYSAYPHLTTSVIRRNEAIRNGLEAKAITASEAETWLKLFGSVPRPVSEIQTDQIQGLALNSYRNLLEGVLVALAFPDEGTDCRAWLGGVSGQVSFGDVKPTDCAMAVALSASGLERLGPVAAGALAAQFSPAFAMGMASEARRNVLGDVGDNAAAKWKWGAPDTPVDAVLLIYAKDPQTLKTCLAKETARWESFGLKLQRKICLHQLPLSGEAVKEPFGFVDGISQPSIRGLLSSRGALARDLLEPGEFILGYPDGRGQFPPTPQVFVKDDPEKLLPDLPPGFPRPPNDPPVRDLGRNGSYLAIRQLEQDVAGFWKYVNAEAVKLCEPADTLAAKMVGRWSNGAPLVSFPQAPPASYDPSPKDENFLFGRDDPQGLACPFGAHIRRANPRDQFDPGDKTQISITNRHRIIRRGRSYVDGDESSAEAKGLLFMCLNADIERQFEFLQQTWIGSTSFSSLRNEADPLTALNRTDGTYTIPTLNGPKQLASMPSFVSVKGGGYFFLPGRQTLDFLSGSTPAGGVAQQSRADQDDHQGSDARALRPAALAGRRWPAPVSGPA